jgi:hypothetical protein
MNMVLINLLCKCHVFLVYNIRSFLFYIDKNVLNQHKHNNYQISILNGNCRNNLKYVIKCMYKNIFVYN